MEVDMNKPKHTKIVPLGRVSTLTRATFEGKRDEPGSLVLHYPI
jgi:hypothetical protein